MGATDLGPVGENFGAACDQIDRSHTMLAGLHARARHRVTTRLRAVQHGYQAVAAHDIACTPPEPTRTSLAPGLQASRQIKLEAEP